jgi:hypothetical protein
MPLAGHAERPGDGSPTETPAFEAVDLGMTAASIRAGDRDRTGMASLEAESRSIAGQLLRTDALAVMAVGFLRSGRCS